HWTVADIRPYILHTLDCFGEDRVLFGSDWPVVLEASTYARWVAALDEITVGASPAALTRLWSTNARRAYRL
ncbi:MAG: amidohydrolase family protein, partial [Chloroflexi bacterium]|nr:amidohydrolase family protein [Chloroflexota bacterium]